MFVIISSRRPHNCKTGHFTSQKERERLRNVKNENCTCKACKTIVFQNKICKFVTFLLPSSSWLRKLPKLTSNHMIFLVQFGKISTCKFFKRPQIALAPWARAILLIYSGSFIPNCARNHVIGRIYTRDDLTNRVDDLSAPKRLRSASINSRKGETTLPSDDLAI